MNIIQTRPVLKKKLRAYLDEWIFGPYNLVFIIEFSKHVGPTKNFVFGLVINIYFHNSKLKILS